MERTNLIGKVAAVIVIDCEITVVMNRGEREGVQANDFYGIKNYDYADNNIGVLLQVTRVESKMSFLKEVWTDTINCPQIADGVELFLLTISDAY